MIVLGTYKIFPKLKNVNKFLDTFCVILAPTIYLPSFVYCIPCAFQLIQHKKFAGFVIAS